MEEKSMCRVEVTLAERIGEDTENEVRKSTNYENDALVIHEDVLPVFEQALKGFGYFMDGKHLEIVDDER